MLRSQEETVGNIRDASRRALGAIKSVETIVSAFRDSSGRTLSIGDVVGQSYSIPEAVNEAKRVLNTLSRTSWQRAGLATIAASGNVLSAAQSVEGSVQALLAPLQALENEHRPFRVEDGPRLVATITGDEIFDAGSAIAALVQNIETLKAALAPFLIYPRDDGAANADDIALVARQAKAASDAETSAREALAGSVQVHEEIKASLDAIRNEQANVESESIEQRTRLDGLASEIEAFKSRADTAAASLEEHWTRADEAVTQLNGLVSTGGQKHDELIAFSKELSEIQERLKKAEARAEDANLRHKGISRI